MTSVSQDALHFSPRESQHFQNGAGGTLTSRNKNNTCFNNYKLDQGTHVGEKRTLERATHPPSTTTATTQLIGGTRSFPLVVWVQPAAARRLRR